MDETMADGYLKYGKKAVSAADAALAIPEKSAKEPSRGTGKLKNFHGIVFDTTKDGNLIVTDRIISETMLETYERKLRGESRWASPLRIVEVIKALDTQFYAMSRDREWARKRFVQETDLFLEYTAEQVNYLGVGMGFEHFHWLGHDPLVAHAFILAWNLQYIHPSSPGEHHWAELGFRLYHFVIENNQ